MYDVRTQSIHCFSLLKLSKKNQLCVLMCLIFIYHQCLHASELLSYNIWKINFIGANIVMNNVHHKLWISTISNRTFFNDKKLSMHYKMVGNSHIWLVHTGNWETKFKCFSCYNYLILNLSSHRCLHKKSQKNWRCLAWRREGKRSLVPVDKYLKATILWKRNYTCLLYLFQLAGI